LPIWPIVHIPDDSLIDDDDDDDDFLEQLVE
jgi:hypothetical protein